MDGMSHGRHVTWVSCHMDVSCDRSWWIRRFGVSICRLGVSLTVGPEDGIRREGWGKAGRQAGRAAAAGQSHTGFRQLLPESE